MSNFSKEKNHAIVIDQKKGLMIHLISPSQRDSFVHDVAEDYFIPLDVKPIGDQEDLILLVNDGRPPREALVAPWAPSTPKLNAWATTLIIKGKLCVDTNIHIIGDAYLLRKKGDTLEALTKEDASDILLMLTR